MDRGTVEERRKKKRAEGEMTEGRKKITEERKATRSKEKKGRNGRRKK